MDPIIQPPGRSDTSNPDTDIAGILLRAGRTLKQGIVAIFNGVGWFFSGLLLVILFLLRNGLWIALGTSVGLSYGIYMLNKRGAKFQSQMVVKANFNSSRELYNTVEYLNSAINTGRKDQLGSLFSLSSEEAASLDGFSIEPVESDVIVADMYRGQFLQDNHRQPYGNDTLWLKTITYQDFKNSLTQYDYPYYEITAVSTNPLIFPKLQDGIVQKVSEVPLLKKAKETKLAVNSYEEAVLKSAVANIDSLRRAYNQRLASGQQASGSEGSQLNILQSTPKFVTPELDLFDKLLDLQDQLRHSSEQSVAERNVLEVYSSFTAVGRKVSFIRQSIVRYSILGLVSTIIALLTIALYRALAKFEKSRHIA